MTTAIEPPWHNQRVKHDSATGRNCGESETTVCENTVTNDVPAIALRERLMVIREAERPAQIINYIGS